jgi:hypothetical protein
MDIVEKYCCDGSCLSRVCLGVKENAVKLVNQLKAQVCQKSESEVRQHLANYLEHATIKAPSHNGPPHYEVNIALHGDSPLYVCRYAFANIFEVSVHTIERIMRDLREGRTDFDSQKRLPNISVSDSAAAQQELKDIQHHFGIQFSKEEREAILISDTPAALAALTWMNDHFDIEGFGDADEKHIDLLTEDHYLGVYHTYTSSNEAEHSLSYKHFTQIWRLLFHHVRLKEFQEIPGTCPQCAMLKEAFSRADDRDTKRWLRLLVVLHKRDYMAEKICLYDRRHESRLNPEATAHIHTDTMGRQHSAFPFMGNDTAFKEPLAHRMQGTINHGHGRCSIMRTFNNISSGANPVIHALLLEIEGMKRRGPLPPTLSITLDGSKDNWAHACLFYGELLVVKGVFSEVFFTRLVAHHGAEDVDAWFGHIRDHTHVRHIYLLERYDELIRASSSKPCDIYNVYAMADYKRAADESIGSGFHKYCTGQESIHQFHFTAVSISAYFPAGLCTMWCHYLGALYHVLSENHLKPGGLDYTAKKSKWYPEATQDRPAGTYLIRSLPTAPFPPAPFVPGCAEEMKNSLRCALSTFREDEVKEGWTQWANEKFPESDSVSQYLRKHPSEFYLPLKESLFSTPATDIPMIPRHESVYTMTVQEAEDKPVTVFADKVRTAPHANEPTRRKRKQLESAADDESGVSDDDAELMSSRVEYNWRPVVDLSRVPSRLGDVSKYIGRVFKDIDDMDEAQNPFTYGKVVALVACDAERDFF